MRRRPASAAPVYLARRVVVAALAVAVLALVASAAVGTLAASPAGFGGVPAVASEATPAGTAVRVVARPGDTLWSIAADHRGDVGHRAYLDALIALNGGTSIQAGQVVRLP